MATAAPLCWSSHFVPQRAVNEGKFRTSDILLSSLYSDGDGPLSSWPQPRGSDGDVTPRKDTRGGLWTVFLTLATAFCYRVALTCRCERCNRSVVTSEVTGPNPAEAKFSQLAECGQRYWCTYQRHRAECAPTSPVDIPAAWCECRGWSLD